MRRLVLAALLCSAAAAQPGGSGPEPGRALGPAGAVLLSVGVPAVAVGLGALSSGQGSAYAAVLIVGGVAMGPSAGNLVLGEWGDAATGAGLRVVGGAVLGGALLKALATDSPSSSWVTAAAVGGSLMVVGGAVYDVATAGVNAGRASPCVAVGIDARTGAPVAGLRVGL